MCADAGVSMTLSRSHGTGAGCELRSHCISATRHRQAKHASVRPLVLWSGQPCRELAALNTNNSESSSAIVTDTHGPTSHTSYPDARRGHSEGVFALLMSIAGRLRTPGGGGGGEGGLTEVRSVDCPSSQHAALSGWCLQC